MGPKYCVSMIDHMTLTTSGQGLYEITQELRAMVVASGIQDGLMTVMIQHTSASLTVQENADPTARRDLENWLARLVPENDLLYKHTCEGPDDMPAHIKSALTDVSLSIPITNGAPALGTWQGVFVWEHRKSPHRRKMVIHLYGD